MRLAILSLLVLAVPTSAQQPPPLVAPTDALSPEEEKKGFSLPPGFEAQLVASEPQIQKPMQMAFDARGRLWVTTSYHYPFAAPQGKGTDKLFLLSDIDPATGKAGKVQVFADDLNIPIGVLPLPDCKSVIVSSTGEIRKYTDTNDDGRADKMEVLFSGFGYVDTHGMYNSYTLMPDGWVYSCHGFRNDSKVRGKDGHEVVMSSGHTFRFRPDGSRIEVYTRGQVNPFGIAVDPWFNLYTADCHSKPITQLIPGAYYESFGKPHDGLGFADHVTRHDHGSTGICGLAWYDAAQFPKEYLGCMFVGNVVTSRINFDRIEWRGATPVARELPDFMTSKDLWFRPVDIKLGPDGALYVSDFYNKIIGHYEVDLKHPGRDKERGRLWRIVWKGKGGPGASAPGGPKFHRTDFTKASDAELIDDLLHPNLTVRFLAGHQLRRRIAESKKEPSAEKVLDRMAEQKDRAESVLAWLAFCMEAAEKPLSPQAFRTLLALSKNPGLDLKPEHLTGHLVRVLASRATWGNDERELWREISQSYDSVHQRRALVEAAAFHPHADFVAPLVDLLKKCPPEDTHLRYAARVALRNCLRNNEKAWPSAALDVDPIYVDMALAIPTSHTARLLRWYLMSGAVPDTRRAATAEHIARHGTREDQTELVGVLTVTWRRLDAEPLLAMFRGLQARGASLEEKSVNRILLSTQAAIRLQGQKDDPTDVGDTTRQRAAARVLIAMTSVLDPSRNRSEPALNPDVVARLSEIAGDQITSVDLRAAAIDVLLRYVPAEGLKVVRAQFSDPKTPADVRERLLLVLGTSSLREARLDARDALKDAPYRTAVAVGMALAGSPAGAADLLDAVKMGKAPARLLQERVILERLRAANIPNLNRQIAALTKGLPPLDQKIAELMKKRSVAFTSAKPDKEMGLKVFTKHCAACHKIGEAGGKIAPQLDGVGNRGLERLLEDTLDPNRNVDQAFRARIITTKDERTITGLMLRVEGEVLILADAEGKEVRIPTKEIDSNRETMLSPMPANFGDAIPEADFNHLLAYLLEQRAKEPPKK